jgi:hypothetical protein
MIAVRLGRLPRLLICALAVAALAGPGLAHAAAPCFFLRSWKGHWKTAADARTIYISVSRRVYRLDLAAAYPLLKSPWAVLVYRDSSSAICSPADFRLVVSNQIGVKEQVIVKGVQRLTPAEVAALPKKLRP